MKNAEQILLRLYLLLCLFWGKIQLWAQDDDEIVFSPRGRGPNGDFIDNDGMVSYQSIHFGISDVVVVVLLFIACYVFGKIWKGCSYLLLILAALMYYMMHF